MDTKLQLRVQRYGWDRAASHYQDAWQLQLRAAHDALFELADLKPGMRVIETACGTGLVSFRAAERLGADGYLLATDLSGDMVKEAARIGEQNRIGTIEFARMGAEKLALEADSFDAALSALGLMYLPDPRQALAEMRRVVRPGGSLVATVWGERKNCGWAGIFPIVDAQVASEVCPLFFATGAPNGLRSDFEAAGLKNIQERRQSETLEFADSGALLKAILDGGPIALAVSRFSAELRERVGQEFLASVAEFRNSDGSYAVPGEFVTVRGEV